LVLDGGGGGGLLECPCSGLRASGARGGRVSERRGLPEPSCSGLGVSDEGGSGGLVPDGGGGGGLLPVVG